MNVPAIILTKDNQTREILKMYIDEFEAFTVLNTDDVYNELSKYDKSVLIAVPPGCGWLGQWVRARLWTPRDQSSDAAIPGDIEAASMFSMNAVFSMICSTALTLRCVLACRSARA